MNEKLIKEVLINKGYVSEDKLNYTIGRLMSVREDIQKQFVTWLLEGKVPDLVIEGYTFGELKEKFALSDIGIFLTLDWLATEPDVAKIALKSGYDTIG